jgi:hypothetical protein
MEISHEAIEGLVLCGKLPPPAFKTMALSLFPVLLREKSDADLFGISLSLSLLLMMMMVVMVVVVVVGC